MSISAQTTAAAEGKAWSAAASGWVEYWAEFAAPAREAVAIEVVAGEKLFEPRAARHHAPHAIARSIQVALEYRHNGGLRPFTSVGARPGL